MNIRVEQPVAFTTPFLMLLLMGAASRAIIIVDDAASSPWDHHQNKHQTQTLHKY